jgi:hypothetical protein
MVDFSTLPLLKGKKAQSFQVYRLAAAHAVARPPQRHKIVIPNMDLTCA